MHKLFIPIFLVGLLLIAGCTGAQQSRVVSVTGSNTITVDPDRAVFYISIQSLKDTAEQAQTDNSERTRDVTEALLAAGLDKKDLETQNYNLYRREDWTENGPKFRGYQADNTIKVTTKDLQKTGTYLDVAIRNGADTVQSVTFELSEERQQEIYTEATKKAGEKAQQQAKILAESVGARLGKVVRVTNSQNNYYPLPIYKDMLVAESGRAAEVPINPQQLEVTATVSVDYEIR